MVGVELRQQLGIAVHIFAVLVTEQAQTGHVGHRLAVAVVDQDAVARAVEPLHPLLGAIAIHVEEHGVAKLSNPGLVGRGGYAGHPDMAITVQIERDRSGDDAGDPLAHLVEIVVVDAVDLHPEEVVLGRRFGADIEGFGLRLTGFDGDLDFLIARCAGLVGLIGQVGKAARSKFVGSVIQQ